MLMRARRVEKKIKDLRWVQDLLSKGPRLVVLVGVGGPRLIEFAGDCPVNETTEGGPGARFQLTAHQVTGSEALTDQRNNPTVAHTSYTFTVTDVLAQMRRRVELTGGEASCRARI